MTLGSLCGVFKARQYSPARPPQRNTEKVIFLFFFFTGTADIVIQERDTEPSAGGSVWPGQGPAAAGGWGGQRGTGPHPNRVCTSPLVLEKMQRTTCLKFQLPISPQIPRWGQLANPRPPRRPLPARAVWGPCGSDPAAFIRKPQRLPDRLYFPPLLTL